jgi:tRNA(Ile)-lysidine synthase
MLLADRVLATVRKHGMLPPSGGRVLVALSGGPDSVGLLHLLCMLAARGELTVAGAAHLNHGLREAADADERFCRERAAELGIPLCVQRADVRALAEDWQTSLEDAGRRARYAFLERAAVELNASAVATGHTLDDQAETFLLQLIRGAGPRGLSGIGPKVGLVRRPLLDIRRDEIREWLAAEGIGFREDESNRDVAFTRNRVRHVLVPLLERDFSPGIVEVLARESAIAREDEAYLQSAAIELARSVVLASEDIIEIDASALRSLHPAVASRVVRIALARLGSGRYIGFDHVEGVLSLARLPEASALSLPGQQARRIGERIVLRRSLPGSFENSFRVPLSIPGEVLLERQGWVVSAEFGSTLARLGSNGSAPHPGSSGKADGVGRLEVALRTESVSLPLSVRSRCRGDRLRPAGMQGRRKKLQDLFVDRKIAREERDAVPLVVDREDRILWVVGHAVAEDFQVTEPLQGVLLLKARRLGGLG